MTIQLLHAPLAYVLQHVLHSMHAVRIDNSLPLILCSITMRCIIHKNVGLL